MSPQQSSLQAHLSHSILLAVVALLCLPLTSDARRSATGSWNSATAERLRSMPRRTLWAWERREDLSAVDSNTTTVAWLDQTILIDGEVRRQPRRQPVLFAAGAKRIAVVRIEVRPGIAALQVDFDATRSQRAFYREVLQELRRQMPAEMPLSITALASWCSYDDWIAKLPVDEAVPMLFRMEPDRRRTSAFAPEMRIREPLCQGSVGISTREAWPADLAAQARAGKRIYVFPDRGWHSDLTLLADRNLP